MDRQAALDKCKEVLDKKPWIAPDWEPYAKCSDEEKEQLVLFLNLAAAFAPKSLGCLAIVFEKCNLERQFLMFEPGEADPDFLTKRLTKCE